MGMFDYIRCEMPLPETPEPPPEGLFQTKDTDDQYMTDYTITVEGRLMWRPYRTEVVPPAERPYPDPADPRHFAGSIRRVEGEPGAVAFHGDIEFYTFGPGSPCAWWEYRARFTEGVCHKIELVEYRAGTPEKSTA